MKKKRRISFNIATVIFILILCYIVITLISYATRSHIDPYQVIEGPLSANDTYSALILRSEQLEYARADGYISYYVPNDSRTAVNQIVCSISSTAEPKENRILTDSDYGSVGRLARSAVLHYSPAAFSDTYDLQSGIRSVQQKNPELGSGSGIYYTSRTDGIVAYTIDGYEDVTEETLTANITNSADYNVSKLSDQDYVKIGTPIYKTVNSEEWTIYVPLTDLQTVRLASRKTVDVKFLKDGKTEKGALSFFMIGDQRFGRIRFSSGMSRYITDRFADVEIITNTQTGLKIPVSSLVSKEFYIIPASFVSYQGDDKTAGFYRERTNDDGTKSREFVEATLFAVKEADPEDENSEDCYYVDKRVFQDGDVLVRDNIEKRYTVHDTDFLDGVYCINKGYCVFRRVQMIDRNSEYCIVEKNTSFGLSLYDYIILDSSVIQEEDLVY